MTMRIRRRRLRVPAVIGVIAALMTAVASPAMAAVTLTASGLNATATGTTVTATTTIKSASSVTGSAAGICARSASGANRDFPFSSNVTFSSSGAKITKTATLPVGSYDYWSCAKVAGSWINIGTKKSFTVTGAPTALTGSTSASGQAMPVGNLPKWRQTFAEDFSTPLARGSFPGSYKSKWMSYTGFADSRNKGDYNQNIISMHDGMMDLYLHQVNGRAQIAAPIPMVSGQFGGQTYGKFSVRFKSDALPGYGAAWLLWPDSDDWNQGEIDYPEGGLNGTFWGFNHCINNPAQNCDYVDTKAAYTSWHTTSIEWSPSGVSFLLDGKVLKTSTSAIPRKPLHWVLQTETNAYPLSGASGHLMIDWLTIYSYSP